MHEREIYAIELIKTGALFLKNVRHRYDTYDAIRSLLFYTWEDRDEYILPINREYKPIGLSGYISWADYSKYDFLYIPKSCVDFSILESNHFFTDGSYPCDAKKKKRYVDLLSKFFLNKIDFSSKEAGF